MHAYSLDLRERVVADREAGLSTAEVAMTVRREGFPGDRTPDGFLKRFKATTLGCIFETIEASPTPATIDLGFMLLTLVEDSVTTIIRFLIEGYLSVQTPPALRPAQGGRTMASP